MIKQNNNIKNYLTIFSRKDKPELSKVLCMEEEIALLDEFEFNKKKFPIYFL